MRNLVANLLNYEAEFGPEATNDVLGNLTPYLRMVGKPSSVKWLLGCYSLNQAFQHYQMGEYSKVPMAVLRAMMNNPQYIKNRGAMAILIRSMVGRKNHGETENSSS